MPAYFPREHVAHVNVLNIPFLRGPSSAIILFSFAFDTVPAPASEGKKVLDCFLFAGGLQFSASQGMGRIAAESSFTSFFLNETTCGTVTRTDKLFRTAHEVSATPVTYRPCRSRVCNIP